MKVPTESRVGVIHGNDSVLFEINVQYTILTEMDKGYSFAYRRF